MNKHTRYIVTDIVGGEEPYTENVILKPLLPNILRNKDVTLYNIRPIMDKKKGVANNVISFRFLNKNESVEFAAKLTGNGYLCFYEVDNKSVKYTATIDITKITLADNIVDVKLKEDYKLSGNSMAGYYVNGTGNNDGVFTSTPGDLKNKISDGDVVLAGLNTDSSTSIIILAVITAAAVIGGYTMYKKKRR